MFRLIEDKKQAVVNCGKLLIHPQESISILCNYILK